MDLDVANVLQKGSTSWRAQNVLNLLKAALLLRYFPDDHKNTKTYLKLSKKKSVSFEPPKQENEMEASESLDDLEIRRKTTIKL